MEFCFMLLWSISDFLILLWLLMIWILHCHVCAACAWKYYCFMNWILFIQLNKFHYETTFKVCRKVSVRQPWLTALANVFTFFYRLHPRLCLSFTSGFRWATDFPKYFNLTEANVFISLNQYFPSFLSVCIPQATLSLHTSLILDMFFFKGSMYENTQKFPINYFNLKLFEGLLVLLTYRLSPGNILTV